MRAQSLGSASHKTKIENDKDVCRDHPWLYRFSYEITKTVVSYDNSTMGLHIVLEDTYQCDV